MQSCSQAPAPWPCVLLSSLTHDSGGLVFSYGPKLNMSEPRQALALPQEMLFHLLMNVPEGVPQGAPLHPSLGGVLPLPSCWGATSWRGPSHFILTSHAPLPWTSGLHCTLSLSLFYLTLYISLSPLLPPHHKAARLIVADQGWQGWVDGPCS